MSEPFVLGVNYWPRRKAMYWWSNFDREEVREEFAIIRELGLKMVRIFLLWEDFQPAPDVVSTESLRNLETVCDIAAENGLGLNVTFFTGHMSGPNWAPGWLLQGAPLPKARQLVSGGQVVNSGYRNPYTDPLALSAERLQLSTVVSALKDHPGIAVWNLGNEPDIFAVPPSDADGQNWVRDMTRLIKEIDPKHPVTCGLHVASLRDNVGLRVDQVFAETDFGVMHAYPMYASYARGPLDPDFVPFTCALTRYLSGKPVLMEEFGGCTVAPGEPSTTWNWLAYGQPREQFMASEEDFAAYIQAVLPRLVEVGATGALLWCFADYIPELWNRPPCEESRHERFFGLVRPDGSLKPHAEVLRTFAATQPIVLPTPLKNPVFNITPDEYYQHPFENMVKLYSQYLS
ncbi:MAG TPA: glycoside hydrolase family 2 TIM barrel-domain containing protein [Chloroflexia bacterium]|nr:glycoside hydrolase family 2 TIM barrel-domain containing protein [Chloroflexia bacterium]